MQKSIISEKLKEEYENERRLIHNKSNMNNSSINENDNICKTKYIGNIPYISSSNEMKSSPLTPLQTTNYLNNNNNNYDRIMANRIARNPFPAPRLYKPLYNRVSIYKYKR